MCWVWQPALEVPLYFLLHLSQLVVLHTTGYLCVCLIGVLKLGI